jgi:hypothetical protein
MPAYIRRELLTAAQREETRLGHERIPTHPRQDVAGGTLAYEPSPKSLEKHRLGVLLALRIGREQIRDLPHVEDKPKET